MELIARRLHIGFKKPFLRKYLIAKGRFRGKEIVLIKPLTYMNDSGTVLSVVLRDTGYDIEDMVVICDQLDLPPGICRLRVKGASGGHNGLASMIRYAGTEKFKRIYIGIGRPLNRRRIIDYVLSDPGKESEDIDRCIERTADAVLMLLYENPQMVMNVFNKKES